MVGLAVWTLLVPLLHDLRKVHVHVRGQQRLLGLRDSFIFRRPFALCVEKILTKALDRDSASHEGINLGDMPKFAGAAAAILFVLYMLVGVDDHVELLLLVVGVKVERLRTGVELEEGVLLRQRESVSEVVLAVAIYEQQILHVYWVNLSLIPLDAAVLVRLFTHGLVVLKIRRSLLMLAHFDLRGNFKRLALHRGHPLRPRGFHGERSLYGRDSRLV